MANDPISPPVSPAFPRVRAHTLWAESSNLSTKRRIDMLGGDVELHATVKEANFQGDDWEFVAKVIAEYGLGVFIGWLRSGNITQRLREKNIAGVPSLPEWVRLDHHLCEDIAAETVTKALIKFRDNVLKKDIWKPDKGASLRTFFIRQCMWHYVDAYKKVTRARRREDPTDDLAILRQIPVGEVEDDIIRDEARRLILSGSSERAARILTMRAHEYDLATIATTLNISVDAVKSTLKRERTRIRAARTQEDFA